MLENLNVPGPHAAQYVITSGAPISKADKAMIMIHGRGADAESMIFLSNEFNNGRTAFLAPEAAGNSWYPFRFLEPVEKNEPWLSSGLAFIDSIIKKLFEAGYSSKEIFLLGFSQGACLALEYAARNPMEYAGVIGLSGALIGADDVPRVYDGDFKNCPVFLGCGENDFHIPMHRVTGTEKTFLQMNAFVTKRIYMDLGHTIIDDEIAFIKNLLG